MALTASTMLPLGTAAPDFTLPDVVSGKPVGLRAAAAARATLLMFICNHCPYVKHVNPELVRLARGYEGRGVRFIAISSNDARAYPEDAPARMKDVAQVLGYGFPYLHDETQAVARAYQAACTPDFFLLDDKLTLAYRGRLDDSTPGNGVALSGRDLRAALDSVLAGSQPAQDQQPSMGCNIKWKKG